jgi:signal transduction histidine kinase
MRGYQPHGRTELAMIPAVEAQVEAERVKAVLSQTPVAVLVSIINASLMVIVLGVGSFGYRETFWLVAVLAVGALRLGLWRAHHNDPAASDNRRRWSTASVGAAAIAGFLWGGGAAWLWPDNEAEQLFWVFVVGGMCAGAAALNYAHLTAVLAFIGPAGVPVGLQFALEGSSRSLAASAMILVFLGALAVTARRSSALFGEYVRLRLDAARHAADINAANAQLRQEMEDRRATEESLRQAQKMETLGQLTGGIAHDFANLLMAVLGSLSLVKRRLPMPDERIERLIDNAIQGANRGAALTQRLLAFSRRQALTRMSWNCQSWLKGWRTCCTAPLARPTSWRFACPTICRRSSSTPTSSSWPS